MGGVTYPASKSIKLYTRKIYSPYVYYTRTPVMDGTTDILDLETRRFEINKNEVKVTVGGKDCAIVSITNKVTKCKMPELSLGEHKVKAIAHGGYVIFDKEISITVVMSATKMEPTIAGLNGGARVTIDGVGFDEDTIVRVRQIDGTLLCEFCYKESLTANQIVFVTPSALSAGQANVYVMHEFMETAMGLL